MLTEGQPEIESAPGTSVKGTLVTLKLVTFADSMTLWRYLLALLGHSPHPRPRASSIGSRTPFVPTMPRSLTPDP
jgi:hypothetical protein